MRFFLSVLSILPENGGFIRDGGALFFRFFCAAFRFLRKTDGVLPFSFFTGTQKQKNPRKPFTFEKVYAIIIEDFGQVVFSALITNYFYTEEHSLW